MSIYIENTYFSNYKFPMTDVNSPTIGKTGLTVSVEVSNDVGTFSSSVGSVTELQSGWYILNEISSGEMVSGSIVIVAMANGANTWRDVILPNPINFVSIKSDTAQSLIDISSLSTQMSSIETRISSISIETSSLSVGVTSTKSDTAQSLINISSLDIRVSSIAIETSSLVAWNTTIKSDTLYMIANGVNVTNSAAQLVWTVPISYFETDVTTTDKTPYHAVAAMLNDFGFSGTNLVFYRIDGTTPLVTISTSSDASANLIVAGDTQ